VCFIEKKGFDYLTSNAYTTLVQFEIPNVQSLCAILHRLPPPFGHNFSLLPRSSTDVPARNNVSLQVLSLAGFKGRLHRQ
jgi:hypothetical protein